MKKKFVYPLLAFMSLSFLAGCGPSNANGSSTSVAPSSTEPSVSESKESSNQNTSSNNSSSEKEESSSKEENSSQSSSSSEKESSTESSSVSREESASESSSSESSSSESSSSSSIHYTYREEVSKEPTCEEAGVKSYICNEDATRSYTEPIPALGHLYDVSALDFVWNDYESASVTTSCTREGCDKQNTFNAEITSQSVKDATCTETGEKKYTATVTINNGTYHNDKIETLSMLGHDYAKVVEESIVPTYATDGKLVEKCARCDDKKETPIVKQKDNLDAYGTEENPYLLASLEDWNAFASDAATNSFKDKYIKLTDNIGSVESPITTYVNNYGAMFAGTLLGNEKTLYVNLPVRVSSKNAKERTGLFAFASGASFKDITIEGVVGQDEEGSSIAAALLADGTGTIVIDNCVNKASVYAKDTAAGLVGFARGGSTIAITNSRNEGTIFAKNDIAGGIVGNADGKSLSITGSSNSGTISALKTNCGQIVGRIKTASAVSIDENCQKLGHAYYHSDRLFDENGHYYPCIEENCEERFEIQKHNYNPVDEVPATCTSTGVKAHYTCSDCAGLFVKVGDSYTVVTQESLVTEMIDHVYGTDYEKDANGHWHICTVCGAESDHIAHVKDYEEATEEHGITCSECGYQIAPALSHVHKFDSVTAEVKASYATEGHAAYATCSCGKIFTADSHEETTLEALKLAAQKNDAEKGYGDSEENPYFIANEADYAAFTEAVNNGTTFEGKFVKMSADIGSEENPITTRIGVYNTTAASAKPFKGTFDGDGYSIYLGINAPKDTYYGAFSYLLNATVKNVTLKGTCTLYVQSGTLVGRAESSVIESCKNYANISIGSCGTSKLTKCYVGGIAGWVEGTSTIDSCVNYGSIKGTAGMATHVGGVVGHLDGDNITVRNCVNGYSNTETAEGLIQGSIENVYQFVGGIVGSVYSYTGKMNLENCINYMAITCSYTGKTDAGSVAGIVGLVNRKTSITLTITSCENHGMISGQANTAGIVGRGFGGVTININGCVSDGTLVKVGEKTASVDVGSTADTDGDKTIPGIYVGSVKDKTDKVYLNGALQG